MSTLDYLVPSLEHNNTVMVMVVMPCGVSLLLHHIGCIVVTVVALHRVHHCYRLDKQLNYLVIGATYRSSAVCTMRVSYTSHASATGLVSGHRSSRSDLLRYLNLVSG
jgi:hypothetical protein